MPHKFSGVDVDCDQCFRLVDSDKTARFEPYFPAQSPIDFDLDPVIIINRDGLFIEFDFVYQMRELA